MFTLKTLSEELGIKVNPNTINAVCLKAEKIKYARTHYIDGWVLYYLTMKVKGDGLNKTGTWPAYLVDDGGKLKVVWA